MPMQRFLIRRTPAEVFIWTPMLAKRTDLIEVFAESAAAALKGKAMPDPRRCSIEEIESMSKTDLMIFARLKLEPPVELDPTLNKADMADLVKMAIFTAQPPAQQQQQLAPADATDARQETRPFVARPGPNQAGM